MGAHLRGLILGVFENQPLRAESAAASIHRPMAVGGRRGSARRAVEAVGFVGGSPGWLGHGPAGAQPGHIHALCQHHTNGWVIQLLPAFYDRTETLTAL